MKVQKYIKGNEGLLLKAGLLVGGYFLVVHPLLKAMGVIESKADKQKRIEDEQNAAGAQRAFDPNYYKTVPLAKLVTKAEADAYAKLLKDADDWFDDDEADVYGVFKKLTYKTQVSWIAERFYALYQQDLYGYLSAFLDESEMATVNSIVNNLK